jgi:hypothetical protein
MAHPHRASHFFDGAAFPRAWLERQYGVADWINARVVGFERVHSPDIGSADFSFALNAFSRTSSTQRKMPTSFGCTLANRSPSSSNSLSFCFTAWLRLARSQGAVGQIVALARGGRLA